MINNRALIPDAASPARARRSPVSATFGLLLVSGLATSWQVHAATDLPGDHESQRAGSGSVSLSYQTIDVNRFDNGREEVDIGQVNTHSLYLELEYAVSERWTIKAGLPYIRKRYNGPVRHDPLTIVPPRPEVPFIDNGSYHGAAQDFMVGVNYHWLSDPLVVEPFIQVLIPSHSYPHFGQSAIGQNRWKAEIGADFTKLMPFSNWYYRLGSGYTFVQKTLGVNVNHIRLHGEAGYFFTPQVSANLFLLYKKGNGDSAQNFPPPSRTDERWYQHDRTLRHSYLNGGVGADWFFKDRYQLSGSVFTTLQGDSVHIVDIAASFGITRYF